MSLTGKIRRRSSLRRCSMAIMLGTIVWWVSASTLAQEAAPALSPTTAEGPGANTAPHLVISMRVPGDTPSYGQLAFPQNETPSASASEAISHPAGPATFLDRKEQGGSAPLVLSSLTNPAAAAWGLTDFSVQHVSARQTVERSSGVVAGQPYGLLLDDKSALQFFLHEYQVNYLATQQELADDESSAHQGDRLPSCNSTSAIGASR